MSNPEKLSVLYISKGEYFIGVEGNIATIEVDYFKGTYKIKKGKRRLTPSMKIQIKDFVSDVLSRKHKVNLLKRD